MRSSAPRAGRSSSSSPANGTRASDSIPRAYRTRIDAASARSRASSSSVVLPIPISPETTSTVLRFRRAAASAASSSCRSRSRPTSMRRLYGGTWDAKLGHVRPLGMFDTKAQEGRRAGPEPGSGCEPGSRVARSARTRWPTRGERTSRRLRSSSESTPGGEMATIEETPLDMAKLEAFVFRAVDEVGATLNTALVVMGDRLGLYRALAGAGPLTPAELAERTGTAERYVREWLNAQAAGGYVVYDPESGRYTLPPEQAMALTDSDSPAYLPGFSSS